MGKPDYLIFGLCGLTIALGLGGALDLAGITAVVTLLLLGSTGGGPPGYA